MVQLFLRGCCPKSNMTTTTCLSVELANSTADVKTAIQERIGIPIDHQGLVFGGRQLRDDLPLSSYNITAGSTVHLVYRLLGGKGGFGALLRGQGRDGKVTDNFDACRDLSGRRVRHQTTEQKLAEWKSQAHQRDLEKLALQHIKQMAKEQRRQEAEQVDVAAIREAQEEAVSRTQDAVSDALKAGGANGARAGSSSTAGQASTSTEAAEGSISGQKRKADNSLGASAAAGNGAPAKKSKMLAMLESVGSDEASSSDEDSEIEGA